MLTQVAKFKDPQHQQMKMNVFAQMPVLLVFYGLNRKSQKPLHSTRMSIIRILPRLEPRTYGALWPRITKLDINSKMPQL